MLPCPSWIQNVIRHEGESFSRYIFHHHPLPRIHIPMVAKISVNNAAFLPPANEVCKGYVFTDVCPRGGGESRSVRGGVCEDKM